MIYLLLAIAAIAIPLIVAHNDTSPEAILLGVVPLIIWFFCASGDTFGAFWGSALSLPIVVFEALASIFLFFNAFSSRQSSNNFNDALKNTENLSTYELV